jgi:hypothetical protein
MAVAGLTGRTGGENVKYNELGEQAVRLNGPETAS